MGWKLQVEVREQRAGRHARDFLGEWRGTLVCDDYGGYKALFETGAVIEAGCMAHARRKFHELWANHKSELAEEALKLFGLLYDVERLAAELDDDGRRRPTMGDICLGTCERRGRRPRGARRTTSTW